MQSVGFSSCVWLNPAINAQRIPAAVVSDWILPRDLCRQLARVQAQAPALGVLIGDRDLLDCPNCKLFEDVTEDVVLVPPASWPTHPSTQACGLASKRLCR